MNKRKVAMAVALQVKECGCSHCSHLVKKALGDYPDLIEEFFKKFEWSGK